MSSITRIAQVLAGLWLAASSAAFAQSACVRSAQNSILDSAPWPLGGGASRDGGLTYVSSVKPGENIDVFVELNPFPQHVGKRAEIYLVVNSGRAADLTSNSLSQPGQSFSMNANNQLVPGVDLNSMQPLAVDIPLQAGQRLKIFSGKVNRENGFRVRAMYCLEGNLYYSASPVGFAVDYSAPQVMQVDFPPVSNFAFSGATLNFRGGVESTLPYVHASVELEREGQSTLVAPVLPGGRWQLADVGVTSAMTLSLKVNGQVVDQRHYAISREPQWVNLEGFALDTANRLAYVVDAGKDSLYTVNLDSGARTLLPLSQAPVTTTMLIPQGPNADVALAPDTGKLWVSSSGTPLLRDFSMDGTAGPLQHRIVPPANPAPGGIQISGNDFRAIEYSKLRKTLYVAELMSGQLHVYDVAARQSRLLAQLPGVYFPAVGSVGQTPLGTFSITGVTDIALDEANDRLLAVSMFSKKMWAVNLTSGAVTEIFDQDKATIVGTAPRNLPGAVPYDIPGNALISDGFTAIAYDSKRGVWLLGKRQEVLGINLVANTVTQVLDPVTTSSLFVAELRDLGYDDVRDRYVYVDGALNTLNSYDPVSKQVQRLSGKGLTSTSSLLSQPVLAAAGQNNKAVYSGGLTNSLNLLDFRKESWVTQYLTPMPGAGLPLYTPIGVSGSVRDALVGETRLANDPTRNRHVLVMLTGVPGTTIFNGSLSAPINSPALGIRGIPSGTRVVHADPSVFSSRLLSVDLTGTSPLPTGLAPYEELRPVYSGNSIDLQSLVHVAVKADGSQYMFSNISGELFAMNPATKVMTKLPSPSLSTSPMALVYVGDTLLQLDMLGQLYSVDLDARGADYGKRALVSGTGKGSGPLFRLGSGMTATMTHAAVYVSTQDEPAVSVVDIGTGNRSVVSGAQRGEGDLLLSPAHVTVLQDPRTLYATDTGGLVIIDVDTGDRIIME